MIVANKPDTEVQRLTALERYKILDTKAEEAFDRIVWLASYICDVPISLISIVDSDRQWFKANVGLNAQETSRDVAFCSHAILQEATMVVPNALDDPRFADNPLVTGDPNIRFYAGAPLTTHDGHKLGTLCAIDRKPRKLNDRQEEALRALAKQVETHLEYRRTSYELSEALKQVKTLQGLVPMCAWCRKVRDDEGYWDTVEKYIAHHTSADVTHGICPDCAKEMQARGRERRAQRDSATEKE